MRTTSSSSSMKSATCLSPNKRPSPLFQLIRLRHEVHSTTLTTNIPFSKWGDVFQDSAATAAILDRLIHHSRVFQITGNAYRMKDYKLERKQRSKKKTPDDPRWSTGEKWQYPLFFGWGRWNPTSAYRWKKIFLIPVLTDSLCSGIKRYY